MLRICSDVLLLTDVENFASMYKQLAEECEVRMLVEEKWNSRYRVRQENIICGSKYLEDINVAYYPNIILILKSSENPNDFRKKGITRFIFNHKDTRELVYAFMKIEKTIVKSADNDFKSILKESTSIVYFQGDYEFHFDTNKFFWKGEQIYLSEANKKYLADWLLNGNKDNKKRMSLYLMRERLGKDFLRDVNRFGEIRKEKKDE